MLFRSPEALGLGFFRAAFAFTLAEVLITLGIIGVVAAIIMPSLIQNYQKKITAAKLKKSYSTISNAFRLAEAKHGNIFEWSEWDDAESIIHKYLVPELSGTKEFGKSKNGYFSMCYNQGDAGHGFETELPRQYNWMDGIQISTPFYSNITASVRLADGSCIGINPALNGLNSNYWYFVAIDINGPKEPNIAGKDLFLFSINKKGFIEPRGNTLSYDELSSKSKNGSCNKESFTGGGFCAAKIIRDNWEIKYDW